MNTIAHRLRAALIAGPATSAELCALLANIATPAQVRTAIATEYAGGRITRIGHARKYIYFLTVVGLNAAANPNYLRSGRHRRTRYYLPPDRRRHGIGASPS
jgi:hypothetical protein